MTDAELAQLLHLAIVVLAFASLVLLISRGELREKTLAQSPQRDPGLGTGAYMAGAAMVGLYAIMMILLGLTESKTAAMLGPMMPFVLMGVVLGPLVGRPQAMRDVGIIPSRPGRDLVWAGLAVIVGLLLSMTAGLSIDLIMRLLDDPQPQVVHKTLEKLQSDFSVEFLISVIITAVIIAPLYEEIVFRGILQTCLLNLLKGKRWPTLLITSALFAVTHWWVVPWQGLIPLFVIGLVFGYVYERTGSLMTPILTHALFNASNIGLVMVGIAGTQ